MNYKIDGRGRRRGWQFWVGVIVLLLISLVLALILAYLVINWSIGRSAHVSALDEPYVADVTLKPLYLGQVYVSEDYGYALQPVKGVTWYQPAAGQAALESDGCGLDSLYTCTILSENRWWMSP